MNLNWMNGAKTYIICAVSVAYEAAQVWDGKVDFNTGVSICAGFLTAAAIRHGVTTTTQKAVVSVNDHTTGEVQ